MDIDSTGQGFDLHSIHQSGTEYHTITCMDQTGWVHHSEMISNSYIRYLLFSVTIQYFLMVIIHTITQPDAMAQIHAHVMLQAVIIFMPRSVLLATPALMLLAIDFHMAGLVAHKASASITFAFERCLSKCYYTMTVV